ncbi:hypothetical protein QBC38DRAFT_461033 [Podospora fimiseda]|uniref:Uncharacterized protein n=1 Tax=Podospora fimiseda TaxID=252190 RepID=A0AAN6YS67_9PEZI|nr:hypothetical protein QBC38DRAFT_461033 [Podospora fimiseda]
MSLQEANVLGGASTSLLIDCLEELCDLYDPTKTKDEETATATASPSSSLTTASIIEDLISFPSDPGSVSPPTSPLSKAAITDDDSKSISPPISSISKATSTDDGNKPIFPPIRSLTKPATTNDNNNNHISTFPFLRFPYNGPHLLSLLPTNLTHLSPQAPTPPNLYQPVPPRPDFPTFSENDGLTLKWNGRILVGPIIFVEDDEGKIYCISCFKNEEVGAERAMKVLRGYPCGGVRLDSWKWLE